MERKGDDEFVLLWIIFRFLVESVRMTPMLQDTWYIPERIKTYYNPWRPCIGEMSKGYCLPDNYLEIHIELDDFTSVVLVDAAERVRDALDLKIGESSLTGLELVQETTNKVVLVEEKPKASRDRQKSYVDYRRKPLEFEVGDSFNDLEKDCPCKYRLRLLEELSSVHDTFHVSNLKKCLADANLHVPLNEIKVDKTLRFVEEPVEIMDREIKKLKHKKITLVKVRWNSKRGPEFTWEHKDQIRIKYLQLFVDRVVESAS
ncbi:hypothetical protein Tco_0670287 [Tanacetum coccineum]